jgi:hypothetical protein
MRPAILVLLVALVPSPALAGYSHAWMWKKAPDRAKVRQCIAEMKRVLAASPAKLAGPEGSGKPSITDDLLSFNLEGPDDKIGEPFVFPGFANTRNHCKTNGLDYDPVVVACLLVIMDHFNKEEVHITSDGKIANGEWDHGIALYKKVFQREPNVSKEGGFGALLSNINLKPTWGIERLFIVLGLLAVGWLALKMFLNPRPHFHILVTGGQDAVFKGRFPQMYTAAVQEFFRKDVTAPQDVTVKGWHENGGRFRLVFSGDISDKDQQRVRNFFGLLRKR